MQDIDSVMRLAPVIPVLVIEDAARALPVARALVAGGLRVLEVTLRTPAALEAIRLMGEVEGALVGAGTVLNPRDLDQSLAAGARFIVSPGLTEPLARAAQAAGIPYLPGVSSASDLMRGLDLGLARFKFFPAEAAGGIRALQALAAPFAMARFCPTGGITLASAPAWLSLEAVLCVGGSWLAPKGAAPATIEANAREAAALAR